METRRTYPSKVGDRVYYHSIIGGEITSKGHEVESFGFIGGTRVAWITNMSGCVDVEALTRNWKAMDHGDDWWKKK